MSLSIWIRIFFVVSEKGGLMAKTFEIVKLRNLLTGEERAVKYSCETDEISRKRLLEKLNSSLKEGNCEFCFGERMYMHLLPGLSEDTVRELSSRMYRTAYVVCKRKGKREKVLYLSLLKDSALRFKASIPAATKREKGREIPNPDYFVKELSLCL